MLPGVTNSLAAMLDPETDKTVTDPAEMAALLDTHRSKVLSAKPTDFSRLPEWLSTIQANLPSPGDHKWLVIETHIEAAINSLELTYCDLAAPQGSPRQTQVRIESLNMCLNSYLQMGSGLESRDEFDSTMCLASFCSLIAP